MLNSLRILMTVAVLACALPSYGQAASDKSAQVSVTNGVISVNPDTLTMGKSNNKINWILVTPGYTFAANGIVIKNANGEYGDCDNQGAKFVCKKLKHIDKKQYKYDVNLINSSGQALSLDPIIINE